MEAAAHAAAETSLEALGSDDLRQASRLLYHTLVNCTAGRAAAVVRAV